MLRECVFVLVGFAAGAVTVFAIGLARSWTQEDASFQTGPRSVDSLKLLIVISRHGNRGSSADYPGDPYPMNDTSYWPYGYVGLTPQGRVQMYNLGENVRSLYSGFIPVTFQPDDLRATSTSMDRLLTSGEAFLAGLYPPSGFQVWLKGLDWQPTPLYSDSPDRTVDIMDGCTAWWTNMLGTLATLRQKYSGTLDWLQTYIENATGLNVTKDSLAFILWDKMTNEINEGYELPSWAYKFYPDLLTDYISEEYKMANAGTVEMTRLMAGELWQQMLEAMQSKVAGSLTPDRKLLYYSGHDTSMVALQRILGVTWDDMVGLVGPGSALLIELHQHNTTRQYYVQALYVDGSKLEAEPLTLNITSDFESLASQTQEYLNVDFIQECQMNTTVNLTIHKQMSHIFR